MIFLSFIHGVFIAKYSKSAAVTSRGVFTNLAGVLVNQLKILQLTILEVCTMIIKIVSANNLIHGCRIFYKLKNKQNFVKARLLRGYNFCHATIENHLVTITDLRWELSCRVNR